ncbi:PIN domain-containing protein [Flavobacterium litorale]|uniref:DUF4935 domain-containing protein n=1 Tax=Flavobacterium litorale TaxID=2856519 RepID=A0ABX8V4C1_9FLAO|nr:PIN domain-containing protein [Flavobacterium litorale]QYJ67683.1 hypothetical protein K1I41_09005 [Flavobacterium litorale]
MNIIIDSTEFRKDRGLNKSELALLKDMGHFNLLNLHIPWFVYKESTTTSVKELKTELNKIKNSLEAFNRKGISPYDYETAKKLADEIEKLFDKAEDSNKNLWLEFIKTSKAKLYQFDEKESIIVFNAYFNGDIPFKSVKSRGDIPDAFIFQTIKKIASTRPVHLISGDKKLRCICNSNLPNIITHESIETFLKNSEFLLLKQKYNKLLELKKIEDAKELMLDYEDNFEDAVYEYISRVNYLELYETDFPSDGGEVTVVAIDDSKLKIEKDEIEFIDDKFYVPISIDGIASIYFYVFKADYWIYDYLPSGSDHNKHYYLIEDIVPITLRKTIVVNIEEIKEDQELDIVIGEFDEIILKNPYINPPIEKD